MNSTEDKTRILECILNINIRVINIQDVKVQLKQLNIPSANPCFADIIFHSYIKICTVIEEIDYLNGYCRNDDYLRNVFYCIKPLIEIVKQYEQGFRDMRNSVVAHLNRRDRTKEFLPFWHKLDRLEVPRSNGELEFIWDCLDLIRVILIDRFPEFTTFHRETHNKFTNKIENFKSTFEIKKPASAKEIMATINQRLISKGFLKHGEDFLEKHRQ